MLDTVDQELLLVLLGRYVEELEELIVDRDDVLFTRIVLLLEELVLNVLAVLLVL